MPFSWRSQRGSASLEAILHLPLLLLLLLGGLLIGLTLLIKASLVYHVFANTEDAALRPPVATTVSTAVELLSDEPPPGLTSERHRGFSVAVPIPSQPFAVSGACYSLPVGMPRLSQPITDAALPASSEPADTYLDQLVQAVRSTEGLMARAKQVVSTAEDLIDQADLGLQVVSQIASNRESSRRQGIRLVSSWALDAGLRQACQQDGPWVVTARAVALSEQTKGLR